jgi:uncharacterized protein (TIGR03067 family)
MLARTAITVLIGATAFAVAAPVPRIGKQTQEKTRKLLFELCWRETEVTMGGRESKADFCWSFEPHRTEVWMDGGELAPHTSKNDVILDATTFPARLDIVVLHEADKKVAWPGIVKFEGDKMIWIGGPKAVPYRDDGNYTSRPTEFSSTKENGCNMRVLVPCKYLEQAGSRTPK